MVLCACVVCVLKRSDVCACCVLACLLCLCVSVFHGAFSYTYVCLLCVCVRVVVVFRAYFLVHVCCAYFPCACLCGFVRSCVFLYVLLCGIVVSVFFLYVDVCLCVRVPCTRVCVCL